MRAIKHIVAGLLNIEVMGQVPDQAPRQRRRKQEESRAARQFYNKKLSWQKLELALAANFRSGDWVCVLTFGDGRVPENRQGAGREFQRFVRRLRTARRRRGEETRYIYCIEGCHGREDAPVFGVDGSLEDKRLHIHMVVNATGQGTLEEIQSLWSGVGKVRWEPMDVHFYRQLAKYLTKEAREYGAPKQGEKMWRGSLNLKKPVVEYEAIKSRSVTLTAPEGAVDYISWHEKNPYGYSDCIGARYLLLPDNERPALDYARGRRKIE